MKIKKILGCFLAGVMTVGAMSALAGAEENNEYECEWIDVRPDCNYELTVEKAEEDGEEKCIVKLAGIHEEIFKGDYKRHIDDYGIRGMESRLNACHLNIDLNDGRSFLTFYFTEEYARCYLVDLRGHQDRDKTHNCYYTDYINSFSLFLYGDDEIGTTKIEKNENGKLTLTLEFSVDEYSECAQMLLKCKTTTVMTAGEIWFYDPGDNGYSRDFFGCLSDGTKITGDGKYIDCFTGEEKVRELEPWEDAIGRTELCVDGFTDLPKETVEVKIIDSEEPSPDDTTSKEASPDDTSSENTTVTSESATSSPEISSGNEATAPVEPNTELTDKDSGITVGGNSIGDLQLKVEKGESDGKSAHFDISLLDKNGKAVQPNGSVTVKIPVPEGFKDEDCKVYREESDGSYTDMKAKLENGYLVFDTDHFSKYVVTTEALSDDKDDNKPTGAVIAFAPAILAAAGVLCFKKRK